MGRFPTLRGRKRRFALGLAGRGGPERASETDAWISEVGSAKRRGAILSSPYPEGAPSRRGRLRLGGAPWFLARPVPELGGLDRLGLA
jgi:hypothetical protein